MIRPRWLAHAKAPSRVAAPRARRLNMFPWLHNAGTGDDKSKTIPRSTSAEASAPTTKTTTAPKTAAPKLATPKHQHESPPWRRQKTSGPIEEILLPHELAARTRARDNLGRRIVLPKIPKVASPEKSQMLVIEGLSPSLRSSDFSRLAARDISDWKSGVSEVHQERDPWTLEPLGNYRISFASHAAVRVYQAKLDRIFRVAQIKMHSTTGLWTAAVPPHLRSSEASPAEEEAAFTIAPGSASSHAGRLQAEFSRVKGKWPWQLLVAKLIKESGFTLEPAVVLLSLHPSTLSAKDLQAFIDEDAHARNEPWATSKPYHLATSLYEDQKMLTRGSTRVALPQVHAFRQKIRNRFIIICESPDVAWRFIRSWNQRTLTKEVEGQVQRTVLTASFIEV
ncbi:hypothetical protein AK830_g2203 [Neonectria ditissima]|uniref:Uncharacterized protein n=1 Tax=Neonectria ditissima TaxID=78410 RepID=A0A0P7BSH3_9HYPO|nr:hypothetical protein AK830_g2203 [Neonectria ditissima]